MKMIEIHVNDAEMTIHIDKAMLVDWLKGTSTESKIPDSDKEVDDKLAEVEKEVDKALKDGINLFDK